MSKEIKFNIKLLVDGKEQLVTASTSVAELRKSINASKDSAAHLRDELISVNQSIEVFKNASSAINSFKDTLMGLAASYQAVQQANVQLKTIMEQRMGATDEDIKKVNEVISAQTQLGVVSGTVQKMGAQQVATFLREKGSLETLIPAMNDLLVQQKGLNATQEDAKNVANLMGKAMTGQTSALKRVGITFSDAQANIMKYGTEQQRAAMLAQIITDNVGHMNAQLAKTDAGQLKKVEMSFGAIKVKIGELVSEWLPQITFTAQALSIVSSLITVSQSFSGVIKVIKSFNLITKTTSVISVAVRASMVGMTAVTRVLQAAFTGATISATTLKVAIKSLLISTGVGIAIWALTEAISYLVTSSDKAADSTKQLTAEEEAAQAAHQQEASQINEVTASLNINIARLKEFKGTKEQEWKLVDEMNNTYGDTLGYYSSVADWYRALVANSKDYCNQMINEIRIRNLANKAADLDQKIHDVRYDENGNLKRYSKSRQQTSVVKDINGLPIVQTTNTKSELDKANAQIAGYRKQEQALKSQMEGLVKENNTRQFKYTKGHTSVRPTKGGGKTTGHTPKKTTTSAKTTGHTPTKTTTTEEPKTYVEKLQEQLQEAQKVMGNALTVDARVEANAKVNEIQKQIDEATKGKVSIEADAEATYIKQGSDDDKRQSYSNAQSKIERAKSDLSIGLIDQAEAEKRIAAVNKALGELKLKPIEVQFDTPLDKLQKQLSDAQREFSEALTIDAKVKANTKVTEIQAQIDKETNGEVTIKADVEPTYTTKGSIEDKRQSYSNAQNKVSRIQSDYEIGLIGAEEAQKQLDEINAQIKDLGNLKPLTIEVETKGFDKTFNQIKDGWSTVEGLGNGIKGIADAIEGSQDAWSTITSLIQGFISVAEGIQSVIKIIDTLTSATQAQTAATTANTAATAVNAATSTASAVAKGGEAAASITNTAAKSGEAVAEATESGSKLPFPENIIAIGAGVAAVLAALAAVSGFATGGIIGGTSTSGDKKFARVNSGEMILNKFQQARLFGMVNGQYQPPTFYERRSQPITMQNITNAIEPAQTEVNINMNADARKLLRVMSDTKRVAKKSGRTYAV